MNNAALTIARSFFEIELSSAGVPSAGGMDDVACDRGAVSTRPDCHSFRSRRLRNASGPRLSPEPAREGADPPAKPVADLLVEPAGVLGGERPQRGEAGPQQRQPGH